MFFPGMGQAKPKPPETPIETIQIHYCHACGCHYMKQCETHGSESTPVRFDKPKSRK